MGLEGVASVLDSCRHSLEKHNFDETISKTRAAWNEFLLLTLDEQEDNIPLAADILGLLSEALWRSGARQDAIDSVASIYTLNPADHELAMRVGLFMRKAKLPAIAMTYYERALELVPGSVRIKMALKALQTDIRLMQNAVGSRHSTEFSFPQLSPLSPSFQPGSPAANDACGDTLQLSSSFASVDVFTVPPSRDEPRTMRHQTPTEGSFNIKASAAPVPAPQIPPSTTVSEPHPTPPIRTNKEIMMRPLFSESTSQTDFTTFTENALQTKNGQRRRISLVLFAFLVSFALHNALEGSSRQVFRIMGIPLSTFSALLAFSAIVL